MGGNCIKNYKNILALQGGASLYFGIKSRELIFFFLKKKKEEAGMRESSSSVSRVVLLHCVCFHFLPYYHLITFYYYLPFFFLFSFFTGKIAVA